MSKNPNLPSEVQTALSSSELETRMLITMYITNVGEDKHTEIFRFVAGEQQNLTIRGEVYLAQDITRSTIDATNDGQVSKITLTMTNKWQESASLFANMGACFINQKCKIEEYFVEYPDETPVLLYYGVMDAPRMTVSQFQIDVIRTLGDYQAESPNMTYDVNCQFRLGDTRCRYSGTETFCDGTLSNCVALGNTLRFGGHPSIPREMVIR